MKSSTINKGRGAANITKGKVKEVTGRATKSPRLELKGKAQKTAGDIQRAVGKRQESRGD
jgi:uncharacterized protein YjbJ (UPF0337 family)